MLNEKQNMKPARVTQIAFFLQKKSYKNKRETKTKVDRIVSQKRAC